MKRFVLFVVAALVAALVFVTRDAPAASPAGDSTGTMTVNGKSRHWLLHRPAALPAKPPLVIALHGNGVGIERIIERSQYSPKADREGFVVVYPSGDSGKPQGDWCCFSTDTDDPDFLIALIDRMVAQEGVDPAKVFMVGHSAGAIMSYWFACKHPGKVAAIGPVSGALGAGRLAECVPGLTVPLIASHGTADGSLAYAGGAATVAAWRQKDGCPTAPARTTVTGPVKTEDWSCRGGTPVTFATVTGGTHTWYGWPGLAAGSADRAYDATAAQWRFFQTVMGVPTPPGPTTPPVTLPPVTTVPAVTTTTIPASTPHQGQAGLIVRLPDGRIVELLSPIPARHVTSVAEVEALIAAGKGPQLDATGELANRILLPTTVPPPTVPATTTTSPPPVTTTTLVVTTTTKPPVTVPPVGLLPSSEFNGTLNLERWVIHPDSCEDFTAACPKGTNVFLNGQGSLVLRIKREPAGYLGFQYSGAWMDTFGYGWGWPSPPARVKAFATVPYRVEMRAKQPAVAGAWTALWMVSIDRSAAQGLHELDVAEERSTFPTEHGSHQHLWTNGKDGTTWDCWKTVSNMSQNWHTYRADVRTTGVSYYVDDVLCGTAPGVSGRHGLILTATLGPVGSWGSGGQQPAPSDPGPWDMLVDWVHTTPLAGA